MFKFANELQIGRPGLAPRVGCAGVRMVLAFLGIVLQAFPFLITGVLLSSLISFFVSERFIERHFPKNTAAGIAFALLGGFCLPVCDCVSIPVFRSLVKRNSVDVGNRFYDGRAGNKSGGYSFHLLCF